MEITLNIPRNEWTNTTEVRQEVVQLICDTFLQGSTWRSLHPAICKNGAGFDLYGESTMHPSGFVTFRELEMKTALKALQDAGYFVIAKYHYGQMSNKWYKVVKRPCSSSDREWFNVTDFNEQWEK